MYLVSKKWMESWQEFVKLNNMESPLLKKKYCYKAVVDPQGSSEQD